MKYLTFPALVRLLIIAFLAFVLTQEVAAIIGIRAEAGALAAEAAQKSGTDSRTLALRQLRDEAADEIATLDLAAVTRTELAGVISEIEAAGKGLGLSLSISSVSAGSATSSTTPIAVKISVETLGQWQANFAFVHLLETLPYKVVIDESRLTLTDRGWRGDNTFTLTILP